MKDIKKAKQILNSENATCVACKNDTCYKSFKTGVMPIIDWLDNDPDVLIGASVADKIIGRASALLLVHGKVSKVYGKIISKDASFVLDFYDIDYSYGKKVDYIVNRAGDGQCPMEALCKDIIDPKEAFLLLKQKLKNN